MPTDGYMDAAAVPVPDAGDDTLRERLAEAIWLTAKGHLRQDESATVADALLPRVREHIAAAVQAERERLASGLDDMQAAYPDEPEVRRGLAIAKIIAEKMWEADHA